MRIESVHASGSRPTSPPDHSLMSQPAPAHVDTLRWKLADASERRQLMATHAGRPQPHAEPAPQASSAPSSLLHAPLAAGVFQDLRYPVPNNFRAADGSPSKFDLTFRDRSGFPNPTSHAYLNRTTPAPGNSWKGLRLDHGPNPTIGGASNWHWNHKGAGGFGIPDHTAATRFESGVGRTLQAAKPLGRAAVVVGAALDGFSLTKEVQASRKTASPTEYVPPKVWTWDQDNGGQFASINRPVAGAWTGAVVGAKAAGSAGAAIGTLIAPASARWSAGPSVA